MAKEYKFYKIIIYGGGSVNTVTTQQVSLSQAKRWIMGFAETDKANILEILSANDLSLATRRRTKSGGWQGWKKQYHTDLHEKGLV